MHYMVIMPVWELLLLVVAVAAGTSIPSAAFGARQGARMAIELCSAQWECPMSKAEQHAANTADLEAQLAVLRARHPELAVVQEAMQNANSDAVIDQDDHKG
jgi:hypothetical protein